MEKLFWRSRWRAYRSGIALLKRLDAHNVVGTLVADNLGSGYIHQLDVLRHDDVGGHSAIDIDSFVGRCVAHDKEDTENEKKNLGFHTN